MTQPLNAVCLLSGGGTTLQNLIDLAERGELPLRFSRVISSRADAYGLVRAETHGIPSAVIQRKAHASWEAFNQALSDAVDAENPDLVIFAGFMSLFWPGERYIGRIMNVHPALIPAFCGKGMYGHHVHEAVIEKGVKITGATVHFVDNQYDHGPIILQEAVEVLDDDDADILAERVQAAERRIYPQAIRLFAEKRLIIQGRRVRILQS
ncbi:MAG: phosphoribosylglycinamide formyltransferase [bacterium]|nr:phosphoribosylglycinamide formyltransferase [bacterium]